MGSVMEKYKGPTTEKTHNPGKFSCKAWYKWTTIISFVYAFVWVFVWNQQTADNEPWIPKKIIPNNCLKTSLSRPNQN